MPPVAMARPHLSVGVISTRVDCASHYCGYREIRPIFDCPGLGTASVRRSLEWV